MIHFLADAAPVVVRTPVDWTQVIVAILVLLGTVVTALAPLYFKVWRNAKTHEWNSAVLKETNDLAKGIDGAVNQKEADEPTLREYAKQAASDAATAALGMDALNSKLDGHTAQDAENFGQLHEDQQELVRLVAGIQTSE